MPEDIMARIRIQARIRDSCFIAMLYTTAIPYARGLSSGRTRARLVEGDMMARLLRRGRIYVDILVGNKSLGASHNRHGSMDTALRV